MILEAQGLSIAGRLDGVTCSLRPGDVTAICGPNGAGKSSLLLALAGLLDRDEGSVALGGTLHAGLADRARRIGYLPQAPEIAWDVTVRSIVELGRIPWRDQAREPVDAAIEALDLAGYEDRRAQALSGGEQARVLLARVLAGQPDWILADEPLAALDLAHQNALIRHLRAAADRGTGVVLVLHDLAMAMNHADRVLVLEEGRMVADGEPLEALSEDRISRTWGVNARWVHEKGARALIAT
ncbi:ABC transporter ATP-binding protein [Qipengyuania sphaerica]|uniref:ABC transporter ATP-binding protein n=1 Tax=Qipengyuania sphaerica TaxID=2867243 RepID=UPI001C87FEEC|nr:ATP-binding cassette domain-containing protein [Qipengyuania sphaerica]MBX7541716.1 ATP-binding cassette domain-containing protein [Qipengyuania sphaerica]